MKNLLLEVVQEYLTIFSNEQERQEKLVNFLNKYDDIKLTDWNHFDGHIVASGFVYAKEGNKFLMVYHNDLKTYLYPGGHLNEEDKNSLEGAIREVKEETGLEHLEEIKISTSELVPIDIDTHKIEENKRLNLPSHYHFDFRYLFTIDRIETISLDSTELKDYKWISLEELEQEKQFGKIIEKIKKVVE